MHIFLLKTYLAGKSWENKQDPHQRPSAERDGMLQEPGTGGRGGGEKMADKQAAARGPKREGHFIFDNDGIWSASLTLNG